MLPAPDAGLPPLVTLISKFAEEPEALYILIRFGSSSK